MNKRQEGKGKGEWGVGSGEWGVGNGEWGVGNGEWGVGNGEWGMGSGEWGVGNGEWGMRSHSPLPIPHSPLQLLLQRANLVVKHLSQTSAFFQNGIDLPRLTEFHPSGKNQVGFIFLQTALSDLQKTNVILGALSTVSLRNIRRNRRTRFAYLE